MTGEDRGGDSEKSEPINLTLYSGWPKPWKYAYEVMAQVKMRLSNKIDSLYGVHAEKDFVNRFVVGSSLGVEYCCKWRVPWSLARSTIGLEA